MRQNPRREPKETARVIAQRRVNAWSRKRIARRVFSGDTKKEMRLALIQKISTHARGGARGLIDDMAREYGERQALEVWKGSIADYKIERKKYQKFIKRVEEKIPNVTAEEKDIPGLMGRLRKIAREVGNDTYEDERLAKRYLNELRMRKYVKQGGKFFLDIEGALACCLQNGGIVVSVMRKDGVPVRVEKETFNKILPYLSARLMDFDPFVTSLENFLAENTKKELKNLGKKR